MNLQIKRLTSDLIDDYLNFFDVTPHSTGQAEHKCYCVCWASTITSLEACSTVEKRRDLAVEYIKNGFLQGYLAYHEDKVIGWCNANTKSNCYYSLSWTMFMNDIKKDDSSIKSIFCFAISPDYRRQGIASKMLSKVLEDAKAEGYQYVESYPNQEFIDLEQDFMGPIQLYEKLGFRECYKAGNRVVMRLKC